MPPDPGGDPADGPEPEDLFERLEAELEVAREELGRQTVEAEGGDGEVRVVMSGTQVCQEVSLQAPELTADQNQRLANSIKEAMNRAIQGSQELAARRLRPLSADDS